MSKSSVVTIVVVIAVLVIAGLGTYIVRLIPNDSANSEALKNLASTETQIFTNLEGNQVTLDEYEGKVRVVNSWASWCPSCATELRDFEELAKEYKDKDVVVLAINRKEPKEQALRFLSSLEPFEHVVFVIDVTDSYFTSVGGFAMPETIFYDAKGNIFLHKRGELTLEEMKVYTEQALNPVPIE